MKNRRKKLDALRPAIDIAVRAGVIEAANELASQYWDLWLPNSEIRREEDEEEKKEAKRIAERLNKTKEE